MKKVAGCACVCLMASMLVLEPVRLDPIADEAGVAHAQGGKGKGDGVGGAVGGAAGAVGGAAGAAGVGVSGVGGAVGGAAGAVGAAGAGVSGVGGAVGAAGAGVGGLGGAGGGAAGGAAGGLGGASGAATGGASGGPGGGTASGSAGASGGIGAGSEAGGGRGGGASGAGTAGAPTDALGTGIIGAERGLQSPAVAPNPLPDRVDREQSQTRRRAFVDLNSVDSLLAAARAAAREATADAATAKRHAGEEPEPTFAPGRALASAARKGRLDAARVASDAARAAAQAAAQAEAEAATETSRGDSAVLARVRRAVAETLDAAGRAREAVDEAAREPWRTPPAALEVGGTGLVDGLRRGVRAQSAFTRGVSLYKQRRYREASTLFAEAIELDPTFDEAWATFGWSSYLAGDYTAAIAAFSVAAHRQPTWEGLYDGLGWSRLRLGRVRLARDTFAAALDLRPDYADAQIGLGEAHFRLGNYDRALAPLEAAARRLRPVIGPDPEELLVVRVRLAWTLYHLQRFPEAVEAFLVASHDRPADHELYLGLGWAYLGAGKKAEARAAFERALALQPGYRDAERGLARAR